MTRYYWSGLALAAVFVAAIGGRAMTDRAAAGEAQAGVVTLDVFSGRPNPSWTLTEAQTRQLEHRLTELSVPVAGAAPAPDLGYRGVDAVIPRPNGALELSANHGVVTLREGGSVKYLQDPHRRLEGWLVETGQDHVAAKLLDSIAAEIAQHR